MKVISPCNMQLTTLGTVAADHLDERPGLAGGAGGRGVELVAFGS